jgi:hypothetical protein
VCGELFFCKTESEIMKDAESEERNSEFLININGFNVYSQKMYSNRRKKIIGL